MPRLSLNLKLVSLMPSNAPLMLYIAWKCVFSLDLHAKLVGPSIDLFLNLKLDHYITINPYTDYFVSYPFASFLDLY
jgi:hypothetical protein